MSAHNRSRNDNGIYQSHSDSNSVSRRSSAVTPAHNLSRHSAVEDNAPMDVEHSLPSHNWQASKTTIKERIAFMFNNETLADVHFKVGKGSTAQRIPAHKFVLSVGSAVFDAMFNGNLGTQTDEIEVPDVEPAALFALLR